MHPDKSKTLSIVWFRQDLRLEDNPALVAAAKRGAILPVYIHSPEEEGAWAPGAASQYWLHQSLKSLAKKLQGKKSRLIFRRGPTDSALKKLLQETGASAVFFNRRYEPAIVQRDTELKKTLQKSGVRIESFKANLLFDPWEIATGQGEPYKVFTPFWKNCLSRPEPLGDPLTLPKITVPKLWPESLELEDFELEPKIPWTQGIAATWKVGEAGAQEQLDAFLEDALKDYSEERNRPDHAGSSKLSPHLHFGEISPRQIWSAIQREMALGKKSGIAKGSECYLKELGWREFAHHLLYHFPETSERPLRREFEKFPWEKNTKALKAWQRGMTGYPMVDAGMRELWATGWMHNRVRMLVASFLVKHLMIPWQRGAEWFWDTLVDADLANNTLGWQWTAGCGADAAPYFRIFNPISQGPKFDPHGEYVRQWVPELAKLPTEYIHRPWEAPAEILARAKIKLARDYPLPIVDHREARHRALIAFKKLKGKI